MITLKIGLQFMYDELSEKDDNIYYYCIDSMNFYKGEESIDQRVNIAVIRSPYPYEDTMYVVDDSVMNYIDSEYVVIGTAYSMRSDEPFSADEYQSLLELSATLDTPEQEAIRNNVVADEPSTMSTPVINNIENNEDTERIVRVSSLDEVKDPVDGMVVELYDDKTDSSILYEYTNGNWNVFSETINLTSYYQNVDYVATPLTASLMANSAASASVGEVDAIDYTEFEQVSGAATLGVVDSSTNEYETNPATVKYVAQAISAATQRLQEYVNDLSDLFDPIGSADKALKDAVNYIDQRLTWNRLE